MEIEILKQEKNEVELRIDNVTVAEILRKYLADADVEFVAWRKEHPSKPAILRIESKGKTVGREVADAVAAIKKDVSGVLKGVKK